jgi:hypothetical protein
MFAPSRIKLHPQRVRPRPIDFAERRLARA